MRAIGASNYSAARLLEALQTSERLGLPRYESLQPLFKVTLGMTIALPVLLYIFILFLRMAAKNKVDVTAPPEIEEDNTENGGEVSE